MKGLVVVLLLFALGALFRPTPAASKERTVKLGGLFDSEDDSLRQALHHAIHLVNEQKSSRTKLKFTYDTQSVPLYDSFAATDKVCRLLHNGSVGLIGAQSAKTSLHVQSMCTALNVPHVEVHWDFRPNKSDLSVNVAPHPRFLGRAVADFIKSRKWYRHCTIIYDDNEGLSRLQDLLQLENTVVHLQQLSHDGDYRPQLKKIKTAGETRIVIDCSIKKVVEVLRQAEQLGMINEYYDYIITNLDFHTMDLEKYRTFAVNMTGFQLVDTSLPDFDRVLQNHISSLPISSQMASSGAPERGIQTSLALLYDAVSVYANAVTILDRNKELDLRPISCDPYPHPSSHGTMLIEALRKVNSSGITGPIRFDKHGFRTYFNLKIIKVDKEGLQVLADWNNETGVVYRMSEKEQQKTADDLLINKTIIISTIKNEPFFMEKANSVQFSDDDRYEGFIVDFVRELAKREKFKFRLQPVADGKYGDNKNHGKWNGMIGELLEQKADAVVADLTITRLRQDVVDFTTPFMHLGIGILFKKPSKVIPSLFSFLDPMKAEVWIYMVTAYLGVSVVLFLLARFSPNEWDNPHPCKPNPDMLENTLGLLNSFWFTIGSLMQQGCDIAPKAGSTRVIAAVWWFFTLIMISSYTANLAAFLTSQRLILPIKTVEDLNAQFKIKYGCVQGGSTQNFFMSSTSRIYSEMWDKMVNEDPVVFTESNKEGVDRVKKGNYAFFMESIQIEYLINKDCGLTQVGSQLDNKGYGIATKKGSPWWHKLNRAVLQLQEDGTLLALKKRWWERRVGQKQCTVEKQTSPTTKLGIEHVGGVFALLMGGMGVACIIGIFEFVWNTHKTVHEQSDTVCNEMSKELKFVLSCGNSTKPVVKSTSEPENGLAIPLAGYGGCGYKYSSPMQRMPITLTRTFKFIFGLILNSHTCVVLLLAFQ